MDSKIRDQDFEGFKGTNIAPAVNPTDVPQFQQIPVRVVARGSVVVPPNSVGFFVASGVRLPGETLKIFSFVSSLVPTEYAEGFSSLNVMYRLQQLAGPLDWTLVADNNFLADPVTLDWSILAVKP